MATYKLPEDQTSRAQPHPSKRDALSAYDERPGYLRNSGQGYLFRNEAPAMSPDQRYSKRYTREGERLPTMYHGTNDPGLRPGTAIEPGHAGEGGSSNYLNPRVAMDAAAKKHTDYSYSTADPDHAWYYAQKAVQAKGGQPAVYEVAVPPHKSERDPEYDSEDAYDDAGNFVAHRTKGAIRVKGKVDYEPQGEDDGNW
jgi:hypothetical protein